MATTVKNIGGKKHRSPGFLKKRFAGFNAGMFFRNVLVSVICLFGIGASLWYFRQDLDNSLKSVQENPAGNVYWIGNTVQRLSGGRSQWDRLEKFSPVYNGDTVSTAPLSEVKLNFSNGEILELSENTTVRIIYNQGEVPCFELLGGEIHIQSGWNNLTVSFGPLVPENKKPILADLKPRTSAGFQALQDYTFKLFEGSGTFSSGENSWSVAAGQAFRTDKDDFSPAELPVLMVTPRNGTRILRSTPGTEAVDFQWNRTGTSGTSINAVTLVIAAKKNLSDPVATWSGSDVDSVKIPLPEGTFFWGLFQEGIADAVDSGQLDILYSPAPAALSPPNNSTAVFTGKNELRFFWTVQDEAEAVLLEVADNPDMNRPRIRQLVRKTGGGFGSYTSTDIGAGKWYWRVYPVFTGDVSEGENSLSQIAGNHGYWRIRPVNTNIMVDDSPSPVNSFTVADTVPPQIITPEYDPLKNAIAGYSPRIVFPSDNFSIESARTPDLVFTWRNPLSYNARFQLAERSDFTGKLLMNESVTGSSIQSIFLNQGTYYWRVTGSGPAGPGDSHPVRLEVTPVLAAPVLNTPTENQSFRMADNRFVEFSWSTVNYARQYLFRIFLEGSTTPLTEMTSFGNSSIRVSFDPNTSGNFYWTVQGFTEATINTSERRGLIATGNFTVIPRTPQLQNGRVVWAVPQIENIEIKQGEVNTPITLQSPASGTKIPGLTILRSPPAVRWTTSETVSNVQLIISSTTNPALDSNATVINANAGSGNVYLPPRDPGRWYW
ncbi:MAG: hypothetical protein FWF22_06305, partial [Treponema sp.]|nr:hypothetical protein [Treponema sp.]